MGLGWALSIGSDVAWVTDELEDPQHIGRVLARAGRSELFGGPVGTVAFGLLGDATGLSSAVVITGLGMSLAGAYVAIRFTEHRFAPNHERRRWRLSVSVFLDATRRARADREVQLVLAATALINGASMVAWLFAQRLSDLGFPIDPGLWWAALGIGSGPGWTPKVVLATSTRWRVPPGSSDWP